MNPQPAKSDAHRKIEELYDAAARLQSGERLAFLEHECAGDDALLREVQSLLTARDRAGDFMETTALETAAERYGGQVPTLIGQQIGRYRIVGSVGAGGMGEVYRAEDPRLGREVAIKILPPALAGDPEALTRFKREARAIAALSHPNILALYDFDSDGDMQFAVMELLDGDTISSRIARGPIPWREAVEIGIAVAEGLSAAHTKGIVHRDIKPDNVFLTRDGRVKILDFGIVRIAHGPQAALQTKATRPGLAIGTVGYIAPEQLRGESAQATADLFSCGCLLHEMVTGRKVFGRDTTADTVAAILTLDSPPMGDSVRGVPPALERVVARCLHKQASERFQSARQLASALRQILHDATPAVESQLRRLAGRLRPAPWIAAGVLPIALAAFLLRPGGPAPAGFTESLAILPMLNQSGDADLDYLSDGITEGLIDTMSQAPHVKVIARTTAFLFKGRSVDPQAAGRELGVRRVFTGKLLRQGGLLSVQVQLVNVADSVHLWEGRYLENTSDMLALQGAIAGKISDTLRLRLSAPGQKRPGKRDTQNREAYRLYLIGRYYFHQRDLNTRGALQKAIDSFLQAIDKDPLYAAAYVGLAEAYDVLPRYTDTPASESTLKAKAAALKALEIDDTTPEANVILASISVDEWDWAKAEEGFRRALLLNPGDATGHDWYGECLLFMGRTKEALSELRLAAELDPLSPHIGMVLGSVLYSDRQYERAIETERNVLLLNPNSGIAYIHIALCHIMQRHFTEANVALDRAGNLMPGAGTGLRAYIDARTGNRQAALNVLDKLEAAAESGRGTGLDLPAAYVGLGDKDRAFEALNRACDRRMPLIQEIKVDPLFDTLRSDPRYLLLLRRMNLTL